MKMVISLEHRQPNQINTLLLQGVVFRGGKECKVSGLASSVGQLVNNY